MTRHVPLWVAQDVLAQVGEGSYTEADARAALAEAADLQAVDETLTIDAIVEAWCAEARDA